MLAFLPLKKPSGFFKKVRFLSIGITYTETHLPSSWQLEIRPVYDLCTILSPKATVEADHPNGKVPPIAKLFG